ncbi:CPBP family intramembrane glutamic endopeptidase [uncultured Desulfosarcina sp.]|uniref:CPBP family intramembrane glutamic endopeptidase n=1 Tax=uncultured Desulfosarcina sp. TaxID=218289 RepID=UPI0029C792C3|nr:CPBP family intramembrane glutamic endopeptidase [uncultured Desulfosarcina sp.]
MNSEPEETNAQLLPEDKTFQHLLWPYVTPYLIYVVLSSIPETMISTEMAQGIKLMATSATLWFFRKTYRFGSLKPLHGFIALLALPVALAVWIGPFYGLNMLGLTDVTTAVDRQSFSFLGFCLRLINSAVLVAVFEELLMRVYVMGWFFQAGQQRQAKGLLGSIADMLDQLPAPLAALPLSTFSVVGTTIVFTAGHRTYEYLSAALYFLFTTWLYKKSGSLWVCVIIHGLTNLAIALLAQYGGMGWLW